MFQPGGSCYGQKTCEIKFDAVYPDIAGKDATNGDGNCADVTAYFFIQYKCEQSEADMHDKYNTIAKTTAIIMFVAFSFILFIWYLQKSQGIDQLENDMNTITASDFTVELDISRSMWDYFEKQLWETKGINLKEEDGEPYSKALYLKKHLKTELDRILTAARAYRI